MHHGVDSGAFDSVLFLSTLEGLRKARLAVGNNDAPYEILRKAKVNFHSEFECPPQPPAFDSSELELPLPLPSALKRMHYLQQKPCVVPVRNTKLLSF
jgi:hypothetical protein